MQELRQVFDERRAHDHRIGPGFPRCPQDGGLRMPSERKHRNARAGLRGPNKRCSINTKRMKIDHDQVRRPCDGGRGLLLLISYSDVELKRLRLLTDARLEHQVRYYGEDQRPVAHDGFVALIE